jgi:polynucleotide 5'-hydroxyl-kinase GRC3/NOL9
LIVTSLDIPTSWREIEPEALHGNLMVVGAPDVGKSTFARFLYHRLISAGVQAAFIDGDPGQNRLGPPSTITLVIPQFPTISSPNQTDPPIGKTCMIFIGSTTPAGHMLPMVTGAALLERKAHQAGVHSLVYDSDGLVEPDAGGLALKLALIGLLRPTVVFAIQREGELERLLTPLRRTQRTRLVELKPSLAVQARSRAARQAQRVSQFAAYFESARPLNLNWSTIAVLPYPRFSLHRLAALEDSGGFTLALGIIQWIDRQASQVTLLAPLSSAQDVDTLHLGDLSLDVNTYRDQQLP